MLQYVTYNINVCHNVFFISDLWSIAKIHASSGSLGILEAPAIAVLARLEPGGWHQTTASRHDGTFTSAWWPLEEKRSAIVPTLSWAMLQIHGRKIQVHYPGDWLAEQFWKDWENHNSKKHRQPLEPSSRRLEALCPKSEAFVSRAMANPFHAKMAKLSPVDLPENRDISRAYHLSVWRSAADGVVPVCCRFALFPVGT